MADAYEVYVGKTAMGRNKSYFVAKNYNVAEAAAKKVLKVRGCFVMVESAWVVGDDLYFCNPKRKGQRKVYAASYLA